jgi:predicted naringenin-chalcone synthase
MKATLSEFTSYALNSTEQTLINQWLARQYSQFQQFQSEKTEVFLSKVLGQKIRKRNHFHQSYIPLDSKGRLPAWSERMRVFSAVAESAFQQLFGEQNSGPDALYHVSCTGYESPSAAQKLVSQKGWRETKVTHLYHMGCYGAMIALRQAWSDLKANASQTVEVVHTEACSLHANFEDGSKEQMIVNSLFSDGIVKYKLSNRNRGRRFVLKQYHEAIVPETDQHMTWRVGDTNMAMTLSREVPRVIAGEIEAFVAKLNLRANPIYAIHPGGPSIIDGIGEVLRLSDSQLAHSRDVFYENGNMSSATLPFIWKAILEQPEVLAGTEVVSLAFGPGLTMCGAVFEVAE